MGVKVLKFGGSSVADAGQLRKIKSIIESDPDRRYIVVSAPGKRNSSDSKVTDLLFMLKAQADNIIPWDSLLGVIRDRYMEIADELGVSKPRVYQLIARAKAIGQNYRANNG